MWDPAFCPNPATSLAATSPAGPLGHRDDPQHRRTRIPASQRRAVEQVARVLFSNVLKLGDNALGQSPRPEQEHGEPALAITQPQAAPEPHVQAVARSQVHREIDRCGGSVFYLNPPQRGRSIFVYGISAIGGGSPGGTIQIVDRECD